jgi:bifunctional UDP-N-acetylglucosamine pyrophosphorylase/glucosamine-1-phosphate N-acetyltransferase
VQALEIVILAAGKGTRMRSRKPKVLQELGGRPLLAHVLERAQALLPTRIQVVVGHAADAVRTAFSAAPVSWVEQSQQLGTGHAVHLALAPIPDHHEVLVLYGDVPLVAPDDLRACLVGEAPLTILAARVDDPSGYGRIIVSEEGRVERIVEERDASPDERAIRDINTGILRGQAGSLRRWLHRGQMLAAERAGEWYLTDVVAEARREGHSVLQVLSRDSEGALGVNDRAQLAHQERRFQRQQAQGLLDAGLGIADPERFDLRGALAFGVDCHIDVNVVLEGNIVLGDDVHIGPGCQLRDVTIGDGSRILGNSVVEESVIGPSCQVGPFARLRPGSVLATSARVGNFVEIKNSRLEAGAKVNHLSYIGDASIGARANIGAGTITCNYDGVRKHRTVIGAEAFIGSNTALVAPISVGARATIGAGSVLTEDAPEEALTLARAPQQTVQGWTRPSGKS